MNQKGVAEKMIGFGKAKMEERRDKIKRMLDEVELEIKEGEDTISIAREYLEELEKIQSTSDEFKKSSFFESIESLRIGLEKDVKTLSELRTMRIKFIHQLHRHNQVDLRQKEMLLEFKTEVLH